MAHQAHGRGTVYEVLVCLFSCEYKLLSGLPLSAFPSRLPARSDPEQCTALAVGQLAVRAPSMPKPACFDFPPFPGFP